MPTPEDEKIYGRIVIKPYDKQRDHEIRVFSQTYAEKRVHHVREFYKAKSEDEWKAGKGISFGPDQLPLVKLAIDDMLRSEQ